MAGRVKTNIDGVRRPTMQFVGLGQWEKDVFGRYCLCSQISQVYNPY